MGARTEVPATDKPLFRRSGSVDRERYAATMNPEACYVGEELAAELTRQLATQTQTQVTDLAEHERAAREWANEERGNFSALVDENPRARPLAQRAALGCAPLGLVLGAWLQWLSAPGNADRETVLAALTLYASDVGAGKEQSSRGAAYLGLLRELGVAEHALPAARLVHDLRIPDYAFRPASLLLAMSRRPDVFFGELLGADLCLRNFGLPPALAAVKYTPDINVDWVALDLSENRAQDSAGGLEQSRRVVACALSEIPDVRPRLRRGFGWALGELKRWSALLRAELEALSPAQEVAHLLMRRAREGVIYHHEFELEGRPLSSWLRESRTEPWPMIDALAASTLIQPGRSQSSALVTGLVDEFGPMFRVFAREDLEVIKRWIDALPGTHASGVRPARPPLTSPAAKSAQLALGAKEDVPTSVREAYCMLQRRVHPSGRLAWAASYVDGWLARSRRRLGADQRQLPSTWTPDGLRPWLLDQHDAHAEEFEASQSGTSTPSREQLIDATVQTAPLTLIDGSWLHGFTDYQHASFSPGHFLFETYWDELGNGEPRLNHPLIYRQLLEEMGVELPPTASRGFAHAPQLHNESFELPVYWLSIGRFPRTFMPEILGLNLAMELSGVGGSYRLAKIHLKRHGFSTRFVDVHNTIDNVATGHAAWAADAVDTMMISAGQTHGQASQAATWQRVRVGFLSLDPPSGRRARLAQRTAQRRSLMRHGLS
jgi:hypothetical protein